LDKLSLPFEEITVSMSVDEFSCLAYGGFGRITLEIEAQTSMATIDVGFCQSSFIFKTAADSTIEEDICYIENPD
jgi:hypothetical protein